MKTVVKVVVGKPLLEADAEHIVHDLGGSMAQLAGYKIPALVYNVVREERIVHNERDPWPNEIYVMLEASAKLLEAMQGRDEAYFEAEIGEGEMRLGKETSRAAYVEGAKDKKIFLMS